MCQRGSEKAEKETGWRAQGVHTLNFQPESEQCSEITDLAFVCRGSFGHPKPVRKMAIKFVRNNDSQNSGCHSGSERKDGLEAKNTDIALLGS